MRSLKISDALAVLPMSRDQAIQYCICRATNNARSAYVGRPRRETNGGDKQQKMLE